ncbi:hypothetical protein [Anabaena sp. CCY 9402-a]
MTQLKSRLVAVSQGFQANLDIFPEFRGWRSPDDINYSTLYLS